MEIQVSPSYTLSYPELHFPDGITVITGPSGVGKTTLLRALHGELNSELSSIVNYLYTGLSNVNVSSIATTLVVSGTTSLNNTLPTVVLIILVT